MAALPETVPIKDSRSRRLNVANSLGIWLVVRFLSAPVGSSLHLSPCGRGRIASLDAIRVRGFDLSLGRNLSSAFASRRHLLPRGEKGRSRCLCSESTSDMVGLAVGSTRSRITQSVVVNNYRESPQSPKV